MFGLFLIAVTLLIGLYLLGYAAFCRVRCTRTVSATVDVAAGQPLLENGAGKRVKFPDYHFMLDGRDYHVRDYNAGKSGRRAQGGTLLLQCDPAAPDRHWYVTGRLWQDAAYGGAALAAAALLGLLYLL